MRMSYLAGAMLGLVCVACATPPGSAARVDDALFVLPGPFSEQTTLADLQAYFGRANVRIVEPGDNAGERRVVLFEADPSRRAFVEFHDAAKLAGVRSIAVRDAASRWRGKQGVHVGMSFAALQAANGKPFGYAGFDDSALGHAGQRAAGTNQMGLFQRAGHLGERGAPVRGLPYAELGIRDQQAHGTAPFPRILIKRYCHPMRKPAGCEKSGRKNGVLCRK